MPITLMNMYKSKKFIKHYISIKKKTINMHKNKQTSGHEIIKENIQHTKKVTI